MKNFVKRIAKGVKKVMDVPKDICKEIVNNKEARLVLGMICIGIGCVGIALVGSVYMPIPK